VNLEFGELTSLVILWIERIIELFSPNDTN